MRKNGIDTSRSKKGLDSAVIMQKKNMFKSTGHRTHQLAQQQLRRQAKRGGWLVNYELELSTDSAASSEDTAEADSDGPDDAELALALAGTKEEAARRPGRFG